jgi:hypothetical protein
MHGLIYGCGVAWGWGEPNRAILKNKPAAIRDFVDRPFQRVRGVACRSPQARAALKRRALRGDS